MNLLVGDIGGTKTILAVKNTEIEVHEFIDEKIYPSAKYNNLEDIISDYLGHNSLKIDSACLAVAGPIANGKSHVTNLPWIVDANKLQTSFKFSAVDLINDLEAIACSIPFLNASDIHTINHGSPIENGNIAVIAPGTGLGEAFLTFDGTSYHAHASEGSHASFSPINNVQIELLNYLKSENGLDHISFERVCSGGMGISNIYNFLKNNGKATEPDWLAEKLVKSDDPTPIIIDSALSKNLTCEICEMTLELFCQILAVEAGNLALKILSTDGVYLAGGIPVRILDVLKKPSFLNILQNKGRFKKILSEIPVRVITNKRAGLIGAATHFFQEI